MELSREEKRLLLNFQFKLNLNASEAARNICEAYGDRTMPIRTAQDWFKVFREEGDRLEDLPRTGRPKEVNRQAVINKIEEEPSMNCRMLADEFDCSHDTIWHILREAGKRWLKSKWVPYELTTAQKQKRFDACSRLFERYSNDQLDLEQIVTCDEKWVAFDNPHRQNVWLSPGQPSPSTPVKDFRKEKRMVIVFWGRRGVIHWELLEKGQSMTAVLYCQILDRVKQKLRNRRISVILLHDNAKPHTAKITKKWLEDVGWEVLEHPPYSPDLAPSDYHLFRSMEHFLRGKKFRNVDEIEENLQNFFDSKRREFYRSGIYMLPDMWLNCIDSEGDYFDY